MKCMCTKSFLQAQAIMYTITGYHAEDATRSLSGTAWLLCGDR